MIFLEVPSLHPFVFPVNVACKQRLYNDDKQHPKLQTAVFGFYENCKIYFSQSVLQCSSNRRKSLTSVIFVTTNLEQPRMGANLDFSCETGD